MPKPPPTLSVVTVCRNLENEIEATCLGVVGQEWRDFEWIVVDGASSDGTLGVLEKYRDRIDVLISEPDSSPYDAMNKGIAAAQGVYCLFLNGGDRLADPAVLGRVFGGARREADILYGDEYRADDAGNAFGIWTMPPEDEIDRLFFAAGTLRHQSTFIRRELFERFGGYDLRYRIVADVEKWMTFAENGCSFERLGFPVSVFRMGGLSSSEKLRAAHIEEREAALAAHYSPGEIAKSLRRRKRRQGYRVVREKGKWPGLSVRETPDGTRRKYALFGVPFLKAKRIGVDRWRYLLFSYIPLWETAKQ